MIIDSQTNVVYYSNQSIYGLKEEVVALKTILDYNNIQCLKILGTRDYFCRDYMPVQIDEDTFIQFRFKPYYLLNDPKLKQYVSNVNLIYQKNEFLKNLNIIPSTIILDGGNLIKWNDKVIITDKVFIDNQEIPAESLIKQLCELLKCQVIIIPRYPGEETGHVDGLMRFVDGNTVLSISLANEPNDWIYWLNKALDQANIKLLSLPQVPLEEEELAWGYINYLHFGKLIIMPTFGYNSGPIMKEFFKKVFPDYNIKTLDARKIIKEGGVLNCFTWNIFIHA
jgi:agmatine deiminase